MIKSIRYSAIARSVAETVLRRHVVWRLRRHGFQSDHIEMGAIPVFQLSLENAIQKDWRLYLRRGWRFICTAPDEPIGAVIGIRRKPWQKPRSSGFSIGTRAAYICQAAQSASDWASNRNGVYVARVVRFLALEIEFLCLYEIGGTRPAWLHELTGSAPSSDWVASVASMASKISSQRSDPNLEAKRQEQL